MPDLPETAFAACAVAAIRLADVVEGLTRRLPVPIAAAGDVRRTCRTVRGTLAGRLASREDVGRLAFRLAKAVQIVSRAEGLEPGDVAPVLYAAAAEAGAAYPSASSPVLTRRYGLSRSLAAGLELVMLCEAILADGRANITDQQAASVARIRVSRASEAAADRIAARLGSEALHLLLATSRNICDFLVDRAAGLAPVVQVDTGRSYPSTWLAWTLYKKPERGTELSRRARCGTPLFMPATFLAPAPKL